MKDLIDTGAIRWVREAAIEYHELGTDGNDRSGLAAALQAAGFEVNVAAAEERNRVGLIRARRPTVSPLRT